ncbi:MAG TPA: ABC transporter permease [Anaerolineaceae bacterium]
MPKTFLVLKNELITVLTRRSFLLTLALVPAVSAVVMLVTGVLGQNTGSTVGRIFSAGPAEQEYEGFVDPGGLVKTLPPGLPARRFTRYIDVPAARQAAVSGEITGFYIVPPDYVASGQLTYVRVDFNPISGISQADQFTQVLQYNLLNGNQTLINRVMQPVEIQAVNLAPQPQRDSSSALTFFLPYAVTMVFYITILSAAGLMLSSVTTEKQNRVIEVLLVSVTPAQMLAGKITALGIAGLLQTVVWSGAGLLLMRVSGTAVGLPAAFQLPTSILGWGVLFFLLGYGVYASLMAGIGALVPNLREASQATMVVIIPLIIPLVFISSLAEQPNSTLALVLSLFPLTAPVAMMSRLAAGSIPIWQLALSAGLLAVTAYLVLRAVAGMFRAQTLLSGQAFSLKRLAAALAGKPV